MGLRPYQIDAIAAWRKAIAEGHRFVAIQLPTGCGKTVTASEVARTHTGRVLWLAHRDELIQQAAEELIEAGLSVGVLSGNSTLYNPYRPVQVGSIQTLQRRELRPDASLIVADECRHYVSDKWKDVLQYYKDKGSICLALDATPVRADGRGLGDIYDHLVQGPSVQWFTENKYLVPCEIISPKRVLDPKTIAKSPIEAYQKHADKRKAIVYAANINAAEQYTGEFNAKGIRAALVTGDMDIATRRSNIAGYKAGEIRVLCNVNVLTEGFDDPGTEVGIIARSIGSISLYLQIVGRLLRPSDGKKVALLIDLFGSSKIFGPPNSEWVYSLEGDGIHAKDNTVNPFRFCGVCGANIDPLATICPECGTERELPKPPDIVDVELVKYGWIRKDPPEDKIKRLAKWISNAIDKGYKPGTAFYKAKSVYGTPPTKPEWQAAMLLANEIQNRKHNPK